MKKIIMTPLAVLVAVGGVAGCATDAQKVCENLSKEADQFDFGQAYAVLCAGRLGQRRTPSRGFTEVLRSLRDGDAHNYAIARRSKVTQQDVGRILNRMIGYGLVVRGDEEVVRGRTRIRFELTERGRSLAALSVEAPRCPHCGAEYFACETDWRGICVRKPKEEGS